MRCFRATHGESYIPGGGATSKILVAAVGFEATTYGF